MQCSFLIEKRNTEVIMTNKQSFFEQIARLDLAQEATELLRGEANIEVPGLAEEIIDKQGIRMHTITI